MCFNCPRGTAVLKIVSAFAAAGVRQMAVGVASALLVASYGSAASAQVTINGTIIANEAAQTANVGRPTRGTGASVCGVTDTYPGPNNPGQSNGYDIIPLVNNGPTRCVTITVTGSACTGGQEAYALLYRGAFNPANLAANFGATADRSTPVQEPTSTFGVTLNAGESVNLVIFSTVVSPNAGASCAYSVTSAQLIDPSAVAAVPTLSEWTMILLGVTLAGGAALYIQRRKLST